MSDNLYQTFYTDGNGRPRQYGIYAPGLDRFIHIDNDDMWMTLQTAELISSKIPTMVYILPTMKESLDIKNCINFCIVDKTQHRIGSSPLAGGQQNPMLKFIRDPNQIVEVGSPEDYKTDLSSIIKLQRYLRYVSLRVYALNITEHMQNIKNHSRFVNLYLGDWANSMKVKSDYGNFKRGLFFEVRKILYLSDSAQQAEEQIIQLFKNNIDDQAHMINGYYQILNEPVPIDVAFEINKGPKNLSKFLF